MSAREPDASQFEGEQSPTRTAKLERIAVLADKLLSVYYEFCEEPEGTLASCIGEYADALQDGVSALGDETLGELKWPRL